MHLRPDIKFECFAQTAVMVNTPPVRVGEIPSLYCNTIRSPCTPLRRSSTKPPGRTKKMKQGGEMNGTQAAEGSKCGEYFTVPLIGTTCCTFIAANDEDGGLIQQGIANLTSLRDAVEHDRVSEHSWFVTASWYEVFLNLLTPLVPVVLLVLVVICCFIPCCQALITKSVTGVMHQQDHYKEQLMMLERQFE